jgi:hypothetical protein
VVLIGIEATSQFTNPHTQEEFIRFQEEARHQYQQLDREQKQYLSPRPSKADGSHLAKQFMRKYFEAWFSEQKELGVPLCDLVWAFRNPHAHSFYPYYQKRFDDKTISGAVDWLYKNPDERIGITISEVERAFESYRSKLFKMDGNRFRVCPQVLFVLFKRALLEFRNHIKNDSETRTHFLQNYKRLSDVYNFEVKQA